MKKRRRRSQKQQPRRYELERTSVEDIKANREHVQDVLRWHWDFYSELAYQRREVEPDLQATLSRACVTADGSGWCRAIKYKHSLRPFSAIGSLADPGGRFNIGDIDRARLPPFACLYLAENKATAIQEAFAQDTPPGLDTFEMALRRKGSLTTISVSWKIENVLDIRTCEPLTAFTELIKGFTVSESLRREARRLDLEYRLVQNPAALMEGLLTPEWRNYPMNYDVPATSQLFGQIAFFAGIEAIIYPSKFTGDACLAVFPSNFARSFSFLQLDDEAPSGVCTRIDASNFEYCVAGAK